MMYNMRHFKPTSGRQRPPRADLGASQRARSARAAHVHMQMQCSVDQDVISNRDVVIARWLQNRSLIICFTRNLLQRRCCCGLLRWFDRLLWNHLSIHMGWGQTNVPLWYSLQLGGGGHLSTWWPSSMTPPNGGGVENFTLALCSHLFIIRQ